MQKDISVTNYYSWKVFFIRKEEIVDERNKCSCWVCWRLIDISQEKYRILSNLIKDTRWANMYIHIKCFKIIAKELNDFAKELK